MKNYGLYNTKYGLFDINGLERCVFVDHPLIKMEKNIPWVDLVYEISKCYSFIGSQSKSIRMMLGLMLIKEIYHHSDRDLIKELNVNYAYKIFCGMPIGEVVKLHSTSLTKFRNKLTKAKILDKIQNIALGKLIDKLPNKKKNSVMSK